MADLLARGNRELAADRIFIWSIPALFADLADGRFITCPNAGVCGTLCYARNGTYLFSNVRKAHTAKLERILADRDQWQFDINIELTHRRFKPTRQPNRVAAFLDLDALTPWQQNWVTGGGAAVRIHDAGDFFDADYLARWVQIAHINDGVLFYAYTKEVTMAKAVELPPNMVIIYSMGGKQDHHINTDIDRHAEVFPTVDALQLSGYVDQVESDLIAPLSPNTRIGIVANNIKHFKKKQGDESFGQLQGKRKITQVGFDTISNRAHI